MAIGQDGASREVGCDFEEGGVTTDLRTSMGHLRIVAAAYERMANLDEPNSAAWDAASYYVDQAATALEDGDREDRIVDLRQLELTE
jgi:hypothetical protein